MNRNKWLIGTTFSVILGLLSVTLGHAQNTTESDTPIVPNPGGASTPMTPALKAKLNETYRLNQAAAAALDAGQYAEAEADARQSMSVGRDSGLAQEFLAAALNAQGRKQEALEEYQKIAGGGMPRNLLPYALLLLDSGQWARAVAAYNAALPDLADGRLMRANSHFSPDVPQPRNLATAIHIALGLTYGWSDSWGGHSQADKALDEYNKALQLAPTSDLANFYYGYGLQRLGRTAQASAAFTKTIKMAQGTVKAAAEQALAKQKKPV